MEVSKQRAIRRAAREAEARGPGRRASGPWRGRPSGVRCVRQLTPRRPDRRVGKLYPAA